jgi:metal-responsive CopG/Arc/MetJ family transcriptional regulator
MKTFTVNIDDKLDRNIEEIKSKMGKTSRAETFRLAIALLKIAADARQKGLKVVLADNNNNITTEVVLPG